MVSGRSWARVVTRIFGAQGWGGSAGCRWILAAQLGRLLVSRRARCCPGQAEHGALGLTARASCDGTPRSQVAITSRSCSSRMCPTRGCLVAICAFWFAGMVYVSQYPQWLRTAKQAWKEAVSATILGVGLPQAQMGLNRTRGADAISWAPWISRGVYDILWLGSYREMGNRAGRLKRGDQTMDTRDFNFI